jgi:acetoin:2,6-dichlorophenolindophenol oxidoreductase subunit beta
MTELSVWRSLNCAIRQAMRDDERVFVMGEDISSWATGGGIFGVTKGLLDEFGPERVRETPISELAITAAAVGAAMRGCRPIVEIMYSDFTLLALDPLVNQAAKARYMFGGQWSVPMVLRTNGGAASGKAAQHSQSLETIFAHIPGLEVVVPSTPQDFYSLFLSSVRSPNPTVFLEHKALYNAKGDLDQTVEVPLGQARIARPGNDLTIIATQLAFHRALSAADSLVEHGVSAEVIDLRCLYPLDITTLVSSARRTGHVLIAHEAPGLYGFGAELAAALNEQARDALAAAVTRVTGARTPIPYSPVLEEEVIVTAREIVEAAQVLLSSSNRRSPA